MDRPENFSLWMEGVWGDVFSLALDSTARLGAGQRHARDPAIAQVAEAAAESGIVRRALAPFADSDGKPTYTSPVTYPTAAEGDFPQRLAGLAAMIAAGLPLRCVALTPEIQFDTHASQTATLAPGVTMVGEAIAAFQADLEARGLADRVLIHVWSEFGRRAQENGSGGTDHGAAGLSMLIGSRVTGRMIGEQPVAERPGLQRQPPREHRLPRHLLLPARAVVRPRRRLRDPRRRALPAPPAAGMRRRWLTSVACGRGAAWRSACRRFRRLGPAAPGAHAGRRLPRADARLRPGVVAVAVADLAARRAA